MKFKNKLLLLIILIFLFLIFFNINNVKAYTYSINDDNTYFKINYTVDDIDYITPNIPIKYLDKGFLIWHSPNNNDKEITFCEKEIDDYFLINDSLTAITYSNKDLAYCNFGKNPSTATFRGCSRIEMSSGRIVVCSSHDVKKSDGTIFFQVPVQETTTIPVLVETVEQIPTVMTKVMEIIIPIGLIILGIGLLIYLIKQVIYSNL